MQKKKELPSSKLILSNLNDPITPESRARIFACIRTITAQIYNRTNKERESRIRALIMESACEHGYPMVRDEDGKLVPKSLSIATVGDSNLVNLAINHFVDDFVNKYGMYIYLYKIDSQGKFKSIGDRTREEMIRDYPDIYYKDD